MMKQLACIYNASSGSATDKVELAPLFKEHGLKVDFLDIKAGEAKLLQKIKDGEYEALIAAGGDGTVRLTAQLAAEVGLSLGVLPVGTLNHFAKDVQIPLKLKDAVSEIARGVTKEVDYCTVNGQVFVNNASIGIYPSTVLGRESKQNFLGKWLAALVAFSATLASHRKLKATVTLPDTTWSHHTPLIFIGNNKYHLEKAGFTSRERLDSGQLFLYAVHATQRRTLLLLAVLSLFGMRARSADFMKSTPGPITIESTKSTTHVALDGEVLKMKFPLEFRMHPRKLAVLSTQPK